MDSSNVNTSLLSDAFTLFNISFISGFRLITLHTRTIVSRFENMSMIS